MKILIKIVLTLGLTVIVRNAIAVDLASNEIHVVTSASSVDLTLKQIKKIYLGMNVSRSGASSQLSVTLPSQHQIRHLFNVKIIGLSEARINTFWAQMRFSGRGKPAIELQDQQAIIEYLIKNPGSIGYLSAITPIPTRLKIIYASNDH